MGKVPLFEKKGHLKTNRGMEISLQNKKRTRKDHSVEHKIEKNQSGASKKSTEKWLFKKSGLIEMPLSFIIQHFISQPSLTFTLCQPIF